MLGTFVLQLAVIVFLAFLWARLKKMEEEYIYFLKSRSRQDSAIPKNIANAIQDIEKNSEEIKRSLFNLKRNDRAGMERDREGNYFANRPRPYERESFTTPRQEPERIDVSIENDKVYRKDNSDYFYIENTGGSWVLNIKEFILHKQPDPKYDNILKMGFKIEKSDFPDNSYKILRPCRIFWDTGRNEGTIIDYGLIRR